MKLMTRAELQALLDAAGITDVTLENTPHPKIVYVRIGGSVDNQEAARDEIEYCTRIGGLRLLHVWRDAKMAMLILRVELLDGD